MRCISSPTMRRSVQQLRGKYAEQRARRCKTKLAQKFEVLDELHLATATGVVETSVGTSEAVPQPGAWRGEGSSSRAPETHNSGVYRSSIMQLVAALTGLATKSGRLRKPRMAPICFRIKPMYPVSTIHQPCFTDKDMGRVNCGAFDMPSWLWSVSGNIECFSSVLLTHVKCRNTMVYVKAARVYRGRRLIPSLQKRFCH